MTWSARERAVVHLAVRDAARQYLFDPRRLINLVDYGIAADQPGSPAELRFHVAAPLLEPDLAKLGIEPIAERVAGQRRTITTASYSLAYNASSWSYYPAWEATTRHDPLEGGISISPADLVGAGTLGALAIDKSSGAPLILSNWHVLGGRWSARPGYPRIIQPGGLDGGTAYDEIGAFLRSALAAHLDAAVATLNGARHGIGREYGIGNVRGRVRPRLGAIVTKYGRTSGLTRGRITGLGGQAVFSYEGLPRTIEHIMSIDPIDGSPVSAPGDSGACWLDAETHMAVGLHFAGSDQPNRALALDLEPVCMALNAELLVP
jgi:endonuclease G